MTLVFALAFRIVVGVIPAALLRYVLGLLFETKTILHEHGPYLTRFVLWTHPDKSTSVLHFFHTSDHGDEKHNHPWEGEGLILAWGYSDERRIGAAGDDHLCVFRFADRTRILKTTYHKATLLRPDRGCWTYFRMGQRGDDWSFLHADGSHESLSSAETRRALPKPITTLPFWRR